MSDRIPCLIPSRNRACQLHLLLESIEKNCPNTFEYNILLKTDNEAYNMGYNLLFDRIERNEVCPSNAIKIIRETNVCYNFYDFLNTRAMEKGVFGLFVDDCIFYNPLNSSPQQIRSFLDEDNEVWSVNLRLGYNTRLHDYLNNVWLQPIQGVETPDGKWVRYNWYKRHPEENYGYYFHWDGVVYRTEDILSILHNVEFKNLREVESYMFNERELAKHRQYFVCPTAGCVCSMQYNCVHDKKGYYGSLVKLPEINLNTRYLNNMVFDLQNMPVHQIQGCHFELMPAFKEYDFYG